MSALLTPSHATPVGPVRPSAPATRPPSPPIPGGNVSRISVTDYERMVETGNLDADAPVELLEGLVVPKMPRNPAHDGTLDLTEGLLMACLPANWFVRTQRSIRLPDDSTPEPDLAVVRGDRRSYLAKHPGPADVALIVEVANSSLKTDLETKARIYAAAGIPAYWVINLIDRVIVAFARPANGAFRDRATHSPGDTLTVTIDGRVAGTISVSDLLV